jgi:very-short-patch-repair endonuclease
MLTDEDRTIIDAIPTTTVERTIFDLPAVTSAFTVELAIDNALRRELTSLDALGVVLFRLAKRGRRGTRLLRGMLAERDPSYAPTESERELMLLRVLREHGLPEPERQFSIHDDAGNFIARPDLVYRELRIAMEYDSYQHHVGKAALARDSRRRNALTAHGWIVLVATAEDVRYGGGHVFAGDARKARDRQLASIDRGITR